MKLRERIGRWLWPEGAAAHEELFRLRLDISDLWWWGVSDRVSLAAAWLRNRSRWRGMDTADIEAEYAARLWPQHPLRGQIGDLRQWLQGLTDEQARAYVMAEARRLGGMSPHLPSEVLLFRQQGEDPSEYAALVGAARDRLDAEVEAEIAAERSDREGYGTERPVIDGEGSRDEPSPPPIPQGEEQ